MDQVEEIKHKLDVARVIGEYVRLAKAGRNFKARCPFHQEKTPSFIVSPERQSWHCFGCNIGGDIFTFLEKIEGIEFSEALKILAQKAGVVLKQFDPRLSSQRNRLLELCAQAAGFWRKCLSDSRGGKARAYITQRKIKDSTVLEFKIGYAPDSWDETMKFLLGRGFSETEIFQAGLTVKKEKGTGYYDRFRDRLMFPIADLHGNVIGFSGRALSPTDTAKYINTPETAIYHKGRVLFGLDKAKQAIREQGYAIVVEGNMDAITAQEAGCKNVVACSGTALTPEQVNLLQRYTENVALCFDQDQAGQTAAERSIDLFLAAEMNVKIIKLVFGKDPDECIKNNLADWIDSLKNSRSVMQFYFDHYFTPVVLADIMKKKRAAKIILARLAKIVNRIERDFWLKKAAAILDEEEKTLREVLDSLVDGERTANKVKTTRDFKIMGDTKELEKKCGELIISILLNYPKLIAYASETLPVDFWLDDKQRVFYKELILFYNERESVISVNDLNEWLRTHNLILEESYLNSLFLLTPKVYEGFNLEAINAELYELINRLKISFLERRLRELSRVVETMTGDAQQEILRQVNTYSEQLAQLK